MAALSQVEPDCLAYASSWPGETSPGSPSAGVPPEGIPTKGSLSSPPPSIPSAHPAILSCVVHTSRKSYGELGRWGGGRHDDGGDLLGVQRRAPAGAPGASAGGGAGSRRGQEG